MAEGGFQRGDVVVCALPGDYGKPRPAVVIQSDLFNETHDSVVVCPVTSKVTGLHLFRIPIPASKESGLRKDSEVMADEITIIQRTRLRGRVGRLSSTGMSQVNRALRLWLELPSGSR
jgi:mRNA interferase MazF